MANLISPIEPSPVTEIICLCLFATAAPIDSGTERPIAALVVDTSLFIFNSKPVHQHNN